MVSKFRDFWSCVFSGVVANTLIVIVLLNVNLSIILYCPDPKEQLGFTKGAQTNDHVLTLKTIVDIPYKTYL